MTYAIMTPIYGFPLENISSSKIQECLENEKSGFLTYYGDCSSPTAFGIILGNSLNECCHHIEVSSFILNPTQEQLIKFNTIFEQLDEDIKKELKRCGAPRVFYLISSS